MSAWQQSHTHEQSTFVQQGTLVIRQAERERERERFRRATGPNT